MAPDSGWEDEDARHQDLQWDAVRELHLDEGLLLPTKTAWGLFLSKCGSKQAAGEAIYSAIFEAAPSLQNLFTTARPVQSLKLVMGIGDLVEKLEDPEALQTTAETLGFQHLHVETTPSRAMIFTEAIIDLLKIEIGDQLSPEALEGMETLLNYVHGMIIFVRTHYADRLRILMESWSIANEKSTAGSARLFGNQQEDEESSSSLPDEPLKTARTDGGSSGKSHRSARWVQQAKRAVGMERQEMRTVDETNEDAFDQDDPGFFLPSTFADMFQINAAVMGLSNRLWMGEVLESFDVIVSNVANPIRLREENDVLALRISKYQEEDVELPEFKACMLAALRALLPKHWTSKHEVAWTWLWENVSRMLAKNIGNPRRYEQALGDLLESLSEEEFYELRKAIYARFFEIAPSGQDYFKQSNTRLHFIADRILRMSLEIYRDPPQQVTVISALGLRHVEYGIPTELFAPAVAAYAEVVGQVTEDPLAVEGFSWSLSLISRILVRTITEGSTVVMKAINANSLKQLRKAIDTAPRSERAAWLLDIQVGTQSISPLSWAIESGSLEVAREIIKDLLAFRADRTRYYYGADELFGRHPDIVKRLVEDAPMLLPTLLDGLTWRSHRPEGGFRRVNYFVKHLLVTKSGQFSDALKWLAATGEPAIIAHPVVVLVSDLLWNGVVYRQFIIYKMWNILNLIVFMFAQGILPDLAHDREYDEEGAGQQFYVAIGVFRLFTYVGGMGRLAVFHLDRIWKWTRGTMKRIFEEIDRDGSGSIDLAELLEASAAFKQSVQAEIRKALRFLRDDDSAVTVEDARKAIATQSQSIYNAISFTLMVCLACMLTHEPLLWCMPSDLWPTDACSEAAPMKYRYSILSMSALVIHWLILVDLAVFSTEISAFLLVCGHVMSEVKQFLTALSFLLLAFGSAIPIFCKDCPLVAGNFSSMPRAIVSLFAITLGWFEADDVMEIRDSDPMLLFMLLVFVGLSVILLLNLLIAQLNRSYEYIYNDMKGFARLNRASLIVDAMLSVGEAKWIRFRNDLHFDEALEFDPGDLGLQGGIQVLEPQHRDNVLEEQIRRYGGSTSPSMPWPEENATVDDIDERFDRLELLVQKAMQRIAWTGGALHSRSNSSGSEQSGSVAGGSEQGDAED